MWGPRLITHLLGYNPILCKEEKVLLHHKLMIGLEEKIPATPDHLLVLTQIWAGNIFWVEILISIPLHSKLCTLPVSSSGSSQKKHPKTNSSKDVQRDRECMFTLHTSLSGILYLLQMASFSVAPRPLLTDPSLPIFLGKSFQIQTQTHTQWALKCF